MLQSEGLETRSHLIDARKRVCQQRDLETVSGIHRAYDKDSIF